MILLRENIRNRVPSFGINLTFPCPSILETTGGQFDFCWIDGQHGPWELKDFLEIVRVCDLLEIASLIRNADHAPGVIGQVLDLGATGIIVPTVETVEQAKAIVQAACFPPLGNRSYGGRRVIDRHTREYIYREDIRPLVISQIETPLGLQHIDAIAAVEGIDVLFFGPDDMKLRMGLQIDLPLTAPELAPAARKVARVCKEHGKLAMTVAGTPEAQDFMLEAGYDILNVGSDVAFVRGGAQNLRQGIAATRARHALPG